MGGYQVQNMATMYSGFNVLRMPNITPLREGLDLSILQLRCHFEFTFILSKLYFTITAEIHARSLANFYGQYADRHMNLKFIRRVSKREPGIRQFVIVKNKLMSDINASVLLLIMNFVITLSK